MPGTHELEVGGRKLKLSNPEKVLYRGAGFTKAHAIDYYARVSAYLLPHLKDRPVTLKRYPDGVHGEFFFTRKTHRRSPPNGFARFRCRGAAARGTSITS